MQRKEIPNRQIVYQIRVQGRLDASWSDWFNGFTLAFGCEGDGKSVTTLTGAIADQATLRGILSRIWDLNLTLISVAQIESH